MQTTIKGVPATGVSPPLCHPLPEPEPDPEAEVQMHMVNFLYDLVGVDTNVDE